VFFSFRDLVTDKKEKTFQRMLLPYNTAWFVGITLLFPVLIPLVLLSTKRRKTVLQRLGITALPEGILQHKFDNPDKNLIWLHALSVGEVISSIPIINRLKESSRSQNIVFSVSTKTGFEVANSLLKENVNDIFFFPYDLVLSVKHITKKIDPDLVIIVETDIWPNFLAEMTRRCVPVVLANARLSKKSFFNYKRLSFFTEPMFSAFSKVCAQSEVDAKRFSLLGVPFSKLKVTGNVKFDQACDLVTPQERESLKKSLNISPKQRIFLAGSTHKGEEEIISDAFEMIKKAHEDCTLIIAPRDPERAGSVSRIFRSAGLSVVRQTEIIDSNSEDIFKVIVIDTIGYLRRLYAIADIAFVGGSLKPFGGHNPLEPSAFSKPVLFGPDMSDFGGIAEKLLESNAALLVKDARSIHQAAAMLISDKKKAQQMGHNAFEVFNSNNGAVDRTIQAVETCLQGIN